MDTLTHIVLGGCIGAALEGGKLGKKAILIGAVAQSLPDIDFLASFWLPTSADLLAHRGFTHSLLFVALVTPLMAWLSSRVFRTVPMSLREWTVIWGLQVFIHVFIDAFNAYGTGWFEPFSDYRFSFNTLYVADPLFSIWPGIAFVALLLIKRNNKARKRWIWFGLGISCVYLLLTICFKVSIENKISGELKRQQIVAKGHITTPTPLNSMLWLLMAETDSGFYMGYRSVFDKKESIDFHFFPKRDSLIKYALDKEDAQRLVKFSQGYYTLDSWHDTIVFNVLRFGEILGWEQEHPRPAFYYYLQYPDYNKLIVQRGRFAGWNGTTLKSYLARIAGN